MPAISKKMGSTVSYAALKANVGIRLQGSSGLAVAKTCRDVVREVNRRLPGSIVWLPHIAVLRCDASEADVYGTEKLSELIAAVTEDVCRSVDNV